jgi:hypothetical protein
MNFRTFFALLALAVPTTLIACAADSDVADGSATPSQDELTASSAAAKQLQGSWSVDPAIDATRGIDFRPSGQFFSDLGAAHRAEGSYTVDGRSHTLTTKVGANETVYRYVYTPAPVLNGFPGPHGFPRQFARLELQQLRPMTTVAVIHQLVQADSWCSSAVDCMLEQQDKTWSPADTEGTPSCNTGHSCELKSTAKDTVVATCGAPLILNGFIDPAQVYKAEISQHAPMILNGFVRPTFKVVVKKGNNVEATLDNCTGSVSAWNLRCTPSDGAVGVSKVFELSDKANDKASYQTQAVSPTAPLFQKEMRCSVEE